MRADEEDLVWQAIVSSNPWLYPQPGPAPRRYPFRRHAFDAVLDGLLRARPGRGLVVLGPRRVGKSVLLGQVVEALLERGVPTREIVLLSLDDVALRGRDLGEVLRVLEGRLPVDAGRHRYLLLDEIQHSPQWSGWLKRLADREDPYVFLATGSSATALRHGGQDAGLGRWREMLLFPWSFREHVAFVGAQCWSFRYWDTYLDATDGGADVEDAVRRAHEAHGPPPPDDVDVMDRYLVDYLVRGGFPEVAREEDRREARLHLRKDILDRALGRDILDVEAVDGRALERVFLRACLHPGAIWSVAEVSRDIGVSQPTAKKYLQILERAFLLLALPNLASPIKGQPRVYLVAPSLRCAMLGLDENRVREPVHWGPLVENLVATTVAGTRPDALEVGFWRRGRDEVDAVALHAGTPNELIEVKRGGAHAQRGLLAAAKALGNCPLGLVLQRGGYEPPREVGPGFHIQKFPVAAWLYLQRSNAGGTLRLLPG